MTTPTEYSGPTMSVAGLRVPTALVPEIVASMRALYPTVTANLDDDPAVRAVLKHWVTVTLSTYQAQKASAPATEQIAAMQEEARRAGEEAMARAQQAAALITEAPETDADATFIL